MSEGRLVTKETDILELTADIWNKASALRVYHEADIGDIAFHIHAIQNIIATRAAFRLNPEWLNQLNRGCGDGIH